jgi:predicted nucleic acid-binding protein
MILADTSIIADILTKDPGWFEWSSAELAKWADRGPVYYNQIVFAELAVKFDSQRELENRLAGLTFLPLSLSAAFQAGTRATRAACEPFSHPSD